MSADETKPGYRIVNAELGAAVDRDDVSDSPFVDRDYLEGDVPLGAVFQNDENDELEDDYAGLTADGDDPFADVLESKQQPLAEPAPSDAAAATVAGAPQEAEDHNRVDNLAFPEIQHVDRDSDHEDDLSQRSAVHSDSDFSEPSGQDSRTGRRERYEVPDSSGDDDEGAFVDDFLNDLDTGQSPLSERRIRSTEHEQTMSADRIGGVSTVYAADIDIDDRMAREDHASSNTASVTDSGHTDGPRRTFPLAMIVLVIAALALLAIGGYGVLQQRTLLQSDIRELQARLATTASREEMEQERSRAQRTQGDNEALRDELTVLQNANSALNEELARMDADRLAAADAADAAEAAAREAQRRQQEAAQAADAGADRSTVANGEWFVNFGSYAQRAMAERWAAKLSVDDGEVAVLSATAAGKPLYRVRVIGLADKGTAERVAAALERQHNLPRLWVGRRESGPRS